MYICKKNKKVMKKFGSVVKNYKHTRTHTSIV